MDTMEDKIYDIITDLLRDDITKEIAIDSLNLLCLRAGREGYKEAMEYAKEVIKINSLK